MPEAELETRLVEDGLLSSDGRATHRWHAAMARSALRLIHAGLDGDDLRVPIAGALIELYGDELDDAALVNAIEVMLPVEMRELGVLVGESVN